VSAQAETACQTQTEANDATTGQNHRLGAVSAFVSSGDKPGQWQKPRGREISQRTISRALKIGQTRKKNVWLLPTLQLQITSLK